MFTTVSKLLVNSKCQLPLNDYVVKLKGLEYQNIQSLEKSTIALSIVKQISEERLNNTNLSNRQKKQIQLIASIEAFKTLDSLIRSIEDTIN